MRDFLRCTTGDYGAATLPAFGAHVNDPVSAFDDIEVVLDDDDGISFVREGLKNL